MKLKGMKWGEYSTNGEMKKGLENMVKNLKRKGLLQWSSYRRKNKKMNPKQTRCLGLKWIAMPQDNVH